MMHVERGEDMTVREKLVAILAEIGLPESAIETMTLAQLADARTSFEHRSADAYSAIVDAAPLGLGQLTAVVGEMVRLRPDSIISVSVACVVSGAGQPMRTSWSINEGRNGKFVTGTGDTPSDAFLALLEAD